MVKWCLLQNLTDLILPNMVVNNERITRRRGLTNSPVRGRSHESKIENSTASTRMGRQ